ncbi:MAG: 6,7-dimethyl-8-ribityllumazine synthase [Ignavibacteriae bacterium]|nr:6,7-dimethyl-8-ribityllumazine synthase [Ignavibacteriota bacterium]
MSARGYRFALVVSRFHADITAKLLKAAQDCLRKHGAKSSDVRVVNCPGAFELPQAANVLVASGEWHAVICLGAVIRGETPHFAYVAAEAARGIQDVALKSRTPVIFGVLTTNSKEQAFDRAGGKNGKHPNKGWDAALAAIEMAALFQGLKSR